MKKYFYVFERTEEGKIELPFGNYISPESRPAFLTFKMWKFEKHSN